MTSFVGSGYVSKRNLEGEFKWFCTRCIDRWEKGKIRVDNRFTRTIVYGGERTG